MVGRRIDRNKLYYNLFATKRKRLSLSIILNDILSILHLLPLIHKPYMPIHEGYMIYVIMYLKSQFLGNKDNRL